MTSPPPPPTRRRLLFHHLVLLLAAFFSGAGAAGDLAGDKAALLAFRDAVGRFLQWNSSSPSAPCSWVGVTCESGRVAALRLPGSGLLGELPAGTLGNLTALTTLSLRYNGLTGSLPADFAGAGSLRNAFLNRNRLSGLVPPVLFEMKTLVRVSLADNNFSGKISPEFNNLTRLRALYLQHNDFSGELPSLNLPSLTDFNVSFNQLNGSIPAKLRSMPASSFLGTGLCGGPLGPCPGELSPSPSPSPGTAPSSSTPAAGGGSSKKSKKLSGGAIAGIAVASALAFAIILFLLVCACRSSGRSKTRSLDMPMTAAAAAPAAAQGGRKPPEGVDAAAAAAAAAAVAAAPMQSSVAAGKKLVFFGSAAAVAPFDLEDLLRASAEVLGKGAFGTTYKAVLETGATVAVKRLKDVTLVEPEFRERIAEIGGLEHECLVPLRAYYYSKDEKLLVYDFMPMGSLSALLHGNRGSGRTPLNWETRSRIALAAARGIAYIHSTSSSISHGNIKSSNILLTKSYEARVSDHGLAALVGPMSSPARATGYRAPEVTDPRRVSQKADVYSFGVLLLELLTGKAPTQAALNEEGVDLPRWVQSVVREEWTAEVFDMELLRYQNVEEEMVQLLQLAIDCVAQHPDSRPPMPEVVVRIEETMKSRATAEDKDEQNDDASAGGDNQSSKEPIEVPKHLASES